MGLVYMYCKYDLAITSQIRKPKIRPRKHQTAMILGSIGRCRLRQTMYEEAIALRKRQITSTLQRYGEASPSNYLMKALAWGLFD